MADQPATATATAPKFTLSRLRLDSQGYDARGVYYGRGRRVYIAQSEEWDDGYAFIFRANDRGAAREYVKHVCPAATFYR